MTVGSERIVFGPFCLDLAAIRILKDGSELELRPQAFRALLALLRHSGHHLDYQQMIHHAWNGTVVSKHTVAVTVGEVKKALGEYGAWIAYRPGFGYRLEIPKSDDLIRTGWHFWQFRTREGFDKALACFQQAALEEPTDSRAHQGIAATCLLLGTYGMWPPREAYPKFLEAHARAVALGGLTPEVRSDRGHGLHMFERKLHQAEAELIGARQEDPKLATTHVRLAMLYGSLQRLDDALDALAAGYSADPLWLALPATEVCIRYFRREHDCAIACAKRALELHPYLQLGRIYYAQALESVGQTEEALRQYRLACVICPDVPWLQALEGACLARNGHLTQARGVLTELESVRQTEYVDAYYLALLLDALGMRDEAFQTLERALTENSTVLPILDVDPKMDSLRRDPRFGCLRDKVFAANTAAVGV